MMMGRDKRVKEYSDRLLRLSDLHSAFTMYERLPRRLLESAPTRRGHAPRG